MIITNAQLHSCELQDLIYELRVCPDVASSRAWQSKNNLTVLAPGKKTADVVYKNVL
jgi:hypothetical protein